VLFETANGVQVDNFDLYEFLRTLLMWQATTQILYNIYVSVAALVLVI
jgi:hypothetical protein